MAKAIIKDIFDGKHTNKQVEISGWIHNKRSSGGILFLFIRDGTGIIQTTLQRSTFPNLKEYDRLPEESTVQIKGMVKEDKRAEGGYEIKAEECKVLYKAEEGFPIAKKQHGPSFLLDNRHFWIRSKKMQAIARVKADLIKAGRKWFDDNGFTEVHVPILVGAACEGGSTLFEVNYFGKKAYLTQSWQLYGEATIAALGKTYTFAPSFRAEKSKTRRHLTEYWHLEAEIPFGGLKEIMEIEENLLTEMLHFVAKSREKELIMLGRDPKYLLSIEPPFKKITYDEAIEILQKDGIRLKWGDDIDWRHEKVLTSHFDKPFFLSHFPKHIKAFYHKPDPARPEVTLSADLLAPEGYGEITGGGERIESYDELMKRIKEEKLNVSEYQWYLDLRKYGACQHAGFGLGLERVVAWVCKLKHIRDAILFPRLINRIYP